MQDNNPKLNLCKSLSNHETTTVYYKVHIHILQWCKSLLFYVYSIYIWYVNFCLILRFNLPISRIHIKTFIN